MSKVIFCLDKSIQTLGITANYLAVEAKVPPNSVYNMVENKTTRIHLVTIHTLLDTMNRIAKENDVNQRFGIEDVIKYVN